jgi:hypothetical protein
MSTNYEIIASCIMEKSVHTHNAKIAVKIAVVKLSFILCRSHESNEYLCMSVCVCVRVCVLIYTDIWTGKSVYLITVEQTVGLI